MSEFPEEIVTISPTYGVLEPERKIALLRLLIEWAQFELSVVESPEELEKPVADTAYLKTHHPEVHPGLVVPGDWQCRSCRVWWIKAVEEK